MMRTLTCFGMLAILAAGVSGGQPARNLLALARGGPATWFGDYLALVLALAPESTSCFGGRVGR